MKVKNIVFIDSYFKGLYGAPKSMLELAEGVFERGHNVTIVSSKNDHLLQQAKASNLATFSLNVPQAALLSRGELNYSKKLLYVFSLVAMWFKCLWSDPFKKADSICVNDIRSFLLVLPLIYKHRNKIIWYVRINDRVKFISSIATYLSSQIILISSDCIKAFTDKECKKYKHKFSVVNTGFNINFNELDDVEKYHNEDDCVFVSVGSICPRKNQFAIIEAFNLLPMENKFLYLIGSPTNEEDNFYLDLILGHIDKLRLNKKIKCISYTNSVKSYLSFSNIFLFASHKEGLPRVLIEALLAGCFVVSAKVDGVYAIINNEKLGLVSISAQNNSFVKEFSLQIAEAVKKDINKDEIIKISQDKFTYSKFVSLFLEKCD